MKDEKWQKIPQTLCTSLVLTAAAAAALIVYRSSEPARQLSGRVEMQTMTIETVGTAETAETISPETACTTTAAEETTDMQEVTTETVMTETAFPDRNLNTADAAALKRVSGIGDVLAEAILNYRAQIGGFTRRAQLLEIRGIGEVLMSRIMAEFEIPNELPPETEPPAVTALAPDDIPQETEMLPPAAPEILLPAERMDVNLVTQEELMRIPDMTEALAAAILDMRSMLGGRYRGIYELVLVEELDGTYFETVLRKYLYVVGDPYSEVP